ncbi:MAG: PorV/PorQ family protein [Candidatus Krumholzibacteriia bacterium]
MTRRLIGGLVLTGLLLAWPATAPSARAGDLIRLFGDDNVGSAGGQFLKIPAGARAVALGKAYASLATDGSAPFWNPAGLMRTPGRRNFFFGHTEYTADIALDFAAVHVRGQNFGYGLTFGGLRSGDILRTTELHQQGTGQYFDANQFYLGLSLARAMTDRFSVGGTVKYYQENLDSFRLKAVLADLGILYLVGIGDLQVGFSVRNFGGDLKPGGTPPPMPDGYVHYPDFQSYSAPTEGAFGVSRTWNLAGGLGLLTVADFYHPSDATETFRFGAEAGIRGMLYLRSGYETSRDEGGFAAGFGLRLERKQLLLRIDYAYSDMGAFGTVHQVSVDVSPLFVPRPADAWRRSR